MARVLFLGAGGPGGEAVVEAGRRDALTEDALGRRRAADVVQAHKEDADQRRLRC